jgi:hypothetical protein
MQNQPPGNLVPPRRALLPRTIFMTVVIPNARGFCGVRDLLFGLCAVTRQEVNAAS